MFYVHCMDEPTRSVSYPIHYYRTISYMARSDIMKS